MRAARDQASWLRATSLAIALFFIAGPVSARDIGPDEMVRVLGTDTHPVLDSFGYSISAYRGTFVVGAPGNDEERGAAYVFVRQSPTNWVQQAKLVSPDGAADMRFGTAVSVSVDTAVIASGNAAHVFVRRGSVWTRQARLAPVPEDSPSGQAVAVDGERLIIVDRSGKAHAYRRANGQWISQGVLSADTGAQGFTTVAMSNGLAIFGAPLFQAVTAAGSAYVYKRNSPTGQPDAWVRVQKLAPPAGATRQFDYGFSVDVGQDRVIVSSRGENDNAGAAYIYKLNSSGRYVQTTRLAGVAGGSRCFGDRVIIYFDRAAVSAPCLGPDGQSNRSVDVFGLYGTAWNRIQRLKAGFVQVPVSVALSTCGVFFGVAGTAEETPAGVFIYPKQSC
jgi:hypothetical protein